MLVSGLLCSRSLLFVLAGLTIACGSSKRAEAPPNLSANSDSDGFAAAPMETVQAPLTQLERKEVEKAIADGFPVFLQSFTTDPALDEEGRFVGWSITRVNDRKKFEGLGIGAGDVIVSVNGLPIERPAQAYEAFLSLKSASSLDVEYLRGGRTMHLSLPIIGEPSPATPAESTPKKVEPAAEKALPPDAAPAAKKKVMNREG